MTTSTLSLFFATAVASYLLVWVIRAVIGQLLLDQPNARSSHVEPTPRGGGIAVVFLSLAAMAAFPPPGGLIFSAAAAAIAAVSLLDDIGSVSWWIRFIVHIASAVAVVSAVAGEIWSSARPGVAAAAASALLLVWIVGLTNAYNFMDGIDGLAGLQAVVGGVAWFLLLRNELPNGAMLAVVIAGSTAGFLVHNLPRARVFLGDVGSAFLGFTFASIGVVAAARDPLLAIAAPLVVWPFVFDTTFTFVRRLTRGERVYEAHRSHIYQRLVQTGLSHVTVSSIYTCVAATGAACAVLIQTSRWEIAAGTGTATLISMPALWLFTLRRESART